MQHLRGAGVKPGGLAGGGWCPYMRGTTILMTGARMAEADPAPYFQAHIFVCCNRRPDGHKRGSCAASGSEALRDYMKSRAKELGLKGVRVNQAGCLDRCEFGPTLVIYPEGIWYQVRSREDVDEVLTAHLVEGGRARRLMLTEKDVLPAKA